MSADVVTNANIVTLPVKSKHKQQIFTGVRRKFARRDALPLRWPAGRKLQYESFDLWHLVARQALAKERVSLDLADSIRMAVFWKTGVITATNKRLARLTGGCSTKTITRRIDQYASLGVFAVEYGKCRRARGRIVKTRTIRLTLPADFDFAALVLPDDDLAPVSMTTAEAKARPDRPDDIVFCSDLSEPPF